MRAPSIPGCFRSRPDGAVARGWRPWGCSPQAGTPALRARRRDGGVGFSRQPLHECRGRLPSGPTSAPAPPTGRGIRARPCRAAAVRSGRVTTFWNGNGRMASALPPDSTSAHEAVDNSARRTPGEGPRDTGLRFSRAEDGRTVSLGHSGFVAGEKGRPQLDCAGTEGQRGSNAAAIHDAARCHDWNADGVDHLGNERHRPHQALLGRGQEASAVAPRLAALGDDSICSRLLDGHGFLDRRGCRRDTPCRAPGWRRPPPGAEVRRVKLKTAAPDSSAAVTCAVEGVHRPGRTGSGGGSPSSPK